KKGAKPKPAANWMLGPIKSWLNENNTGIDQFQILPQKTSVIIKMIDEGRLSFSIASSKLFSALIETPDKDPEQVATEENWLQNSNSNGIENLIDQVLRKFPEKVSDYKKGKKGLMGLFVGEVMKLSKGTADPKMTNDILSKKLKS
ncbi:MAG TPA: Asp-tRNA(Asn)/Glu-tRNA(Gln) amidotransferase GatCAB subunit B, partial [Chitinophagaceae bacterium]